jgi:hypothetical protein
VTSLEATLRQVCRDLAAADARFALVGGLAVSARTEPRFTRDADLAVSLRDDAAAEALILRLRVSGYHIGTVVEQDAVGRLATVRLTRFIDAVAPVVDLLFASSGIEAELVADADVLDVLPALTVPVATVGHLLALKVLSRDDDRPQDQVDLEALMRVASPAELTRARDALTLITRRGFHRGKDLLSEFAALHRS